MADDIRIDVNTKELEAKLEALPRNVAQRKLREAVQAGGEVILRAMVANAPERTDEPTPDSNSLPPGMLRADLQVETETHDNACTAYVGAEIGRASCRERV